MQVLDETEANRCFPFSWRNFPMGARWMSLLSSASLSQAHERLAAMVGPVVLRVPKGDGPMLALAEAVAGTVVRDQDLLTVEEGEGESLTLLDGWGRETGILFRNPPLGQEFGPLLDAILAVSRGGSLLSPLGRSQARELPEACELWVLVTPT